MGRESVRVGPNLSEDSAVITDRDAQLLATINAAPDHGRFCDYVKAVCFYPLKDRLLQAYGTPDGFDLQRVVKECNRCFRGVWRSECGYHQDICWHCGGTGIWRVDASILQRFTFGSRTFHRPVEYHREVTKEWLVERMATGEFRELINGKIKHEPATMEAAKSAYFDLLWKFERDRYWDEVERSVVMWFKGRIEALTKPIRDIIRRAYWWIQDGDSRMAEGREWFGITPIPF